MKATKKYRLKYTDKAKKIVDELSLEEKVHLMSGTVSLQELLEHAIGANHYNYYPYPAGGNERLGVPQMKFCDGPRGVVCGTGKSTCFPVPMLRGATFDVELEERVGNAMGKEVKAFGGNLFAGICINVPYNPGWGRSQETYGEESFHIGQMGAALVRGVQAENVMACVKHYAFNSMEISRFKVNITCEKRTEREVFLPHFKECIDNGAASIMSAYNKYNGSYCGHSDYLLNKVLKEECDFDGFVMSDFIWGIKNTEEAANNGQDMEMCCTQFYGEKLVQAVKEGKVPEEKINQAALRIIRTIISFGDEDDKIYDESVIGCKEHVGLALETARKGITLIRNKNRVLPMNREDAARIAVFGKLANKGNVGDYGSSRVFPQYVTTPLQGIATVAEKSEVIFYDNTDMEYAKKLAAGADYTVFVDGYDHNDEGEYISEEQLDGYTNAMGGDRKDSLGLRKEEIKLIQEVGPVNKNSCVVLIGGNLIMTEEWKDYVSSILMAYYPGMEGGRAIAEILFGDINPSGKLPYAVPFKESDLPQVNWNSETQYYDYYHGYRKLEKNGIKPYLPYGFGLSYTNFSISDAVFSVEENLIKASCKVKNTGAFMGTEVIQMYVGFKNSGIDRPVKILRGFKRVELESGNEKEVAITCPIDKLKWYNPKTESWELEHMEYEIYIGTSSDDNDLLEGSFKL